MRINRRPSRLRDFPREIETGTLEAMPGEPLIVVNIPPGHVQAGFRLSGRTDKVLRLLLDRDRGGVSCKIPAGLWQQRGLEFAREFLEQPLLYPLIIDVEVPASPELVTDLSPVSTSEPVQGTVTTPASDDLNVEILRKVIGSLEKATRASELADEMGVPLEQIKSLAAMDDSGITISPQGWIKLVE